MRFFFLVAYCLWSLSLAAQQDQPGNTDSSKIHSPFDGNTRFILKWAPLSLITETEGPSLRMDLEYRLKPNWSLQNEVGYFFVNTGGLTKFEVRYYRSPIDVNNKHYDTPYMSLEFFYKYQSYTASDTIELTTVPNYLKSYHVSKNVECLTFKLGYMTVLKCGLVLDYFIGAGLRFRQAKNSLSKEENRNIKSIGDYSTNIYTNMADNSVYLNVDIGVKLGFAFKKRGGQ